MVILLPPSKESCHILPHSYSTVTGITSAAIWSLGSIEAENKNKIAFNCSKKS
jgi:hypothetical protein